MLFFNNCLDTSRTLEKRKLSRNHFLYLAFTYRIFFSDFWVEKKSHEINPQILTYTRPNRSKSLNLDLNLKIEIFNVTFLSQKLSEFCQLSYKIIYLIVIYAKFCDFTKKSFFLFFHIVENF